MNPLHQVVFLAFSAVLLRMQRRWLVLLLVLVVILARVHTRFVSAKLELRDLRVRMGSLVAQHAKTVNKRVLEWWVLYIELRIALLFFWRTS